MRHERLEVGQTPACVQACPSGAIMIETNSTTRYTLPDNLPELKEMDEHLLKPAHPELPLVFMTVLTQISLGGFLVLFLGDVMSLFGFESANWIMALLVTLPAALGLPLSALHLGRPFFSDDGYEKYINFMALSRSTCVRSLYGSNERSRRSILF